MKSLFLFSITVMFSFSAYSAQELETNKSKRKGFIEKRQNNAREIMKDNFNSKNQSKEKEANFGFHKKKGETRKL